MNSLGRIKYFSAIAVAVLFVNCGSFSGIKNYHRPAEILEFTGPSSMLVKEGPYKKKIELIAVDIPKKEWIEKRVKALKLPKNNAEEMQKAGYSANSFLEKKLSRGDVIYIEYGFEKKDSAGNHLAYIFLPDHSMLNELFVSEGYSLPETSPDNHKYKGVFYSALQTSIAKRRGMWRLFEKEDISKYIPAAAESVIEAPKDEYSSEPVNSFSIMTFNVENLMDTEHDPGKSDYAFMPLSAKNNLRHKQICEDMGRGKDECLNKDWPDSLLQKKMERVAAAILSYGGRGPDILIMQEVENIKVLKRFNSGYLGAAGYKTLVLIEGGDFRGIDIAIISRFPLAGKPVLHEIPFKPEKSSRGILRADFIIPGGDKITVYGLHFPSQASTVESRIQAFKFLSGLLSKHSSKDLVFAGGDCNVTASEDVQNSVLNKYASDWIISHRAQTLSEKGTSYYEADDSWSYFDILLLSKNLDPAAKNNTGWALDPETIRISNGNPQQKNSNGTPKRFNHKDGTGVSDHWPVALEIKKR